MPDRPYLADMDRRQLLGGGLGIAILSAAGFSVSACAPAPATSPGDTAGLSFSPQRLAIVTRIADLVIPDTDTPGAVAVGVPAKLDEMMRDWASAETRAAWNALIDAIDAAGPTGFLSLSSEDQFETLQRFDAEHIHKDGDAWQGFKSILVDAYYSSEIGATEELRFELVPGAWRASVPFAEIGRAWYE